MITTYYISIYFSKNLQLFGKNLPVLDSLWPREDLMWLKVNKSNCTYWLVVYISIVLHAYLINCWYAIYKARGLNNLIKICLKEKLRLTRFFSLFCIICLWICNIWLGHNRVSLYMLWDFTGNSVNEFGTKFTKHELSIQRIYVASVFPNGNVWNDYFLF